MATVWVSAANSLYWLFRAISSLLTALYMVVGLSILPASVFFFTNVYWGSGSRNRALNVPSCSRRNGGRSPPSRSDQSAP